MKTKIDAWYERHHAITSAGLPTAPEHKPWGAGRIDAVTRRWAGVGVERAWIAKEARPTDSLHISLYDEDATNDECLGQIFVPVTQWGRNPSARSARSISPKTG